MTADESCGIECALECVMENQRVLEAGVTVNGLHGAINVIQSLHPRRTAPLGQAIREWHLPPREDFCPHHGKAATRCQELRHPIHRDFGVHPSKALKAATNWTGPGAA